MRAWLRAHRVECAMVALIMVICMGRAMMAWPGAPIGSEAGLWNQDTDPWLRLTLVRDWLAGGSWYDHEMIRSNAPYGGTQSPWTRPLDVVIAAIAALMQGDVSTRLIKASLLLPGLWAVLYVLGLMRAGKRVLAHPDQTVMVCVMASCLPMMWVYFGVGNADHHAPLAVLFIWMVGSLLGEDPRGREALWVGALLGMMLWISPEALAIIALVFVCMGGWWLWYGEGLARMRMAALALSVASGVAVMIERAPGAWMVPIYDSISIVHVLATALLTAAVCTIGLLPVRCCATRMRRAAVGLAVAGVAALVLWCAYPLFFAGPMVGVHLYIHSDFLPRIHEAQPLWKQKGEMWQVAVLWQPVLAMIALWLLARRSPGLVRWQAWWVLSVLVVGTIALCLVQVRWYYYMAPMLALVLASVIAPLFRPEHASVAGRWPASAVVAEPASFQVFVRQLVLVGVLGIPMVLLLFGGGGDDAPNARANARAVTSYQTRQCELFAMLWMRAGGVDATLGATPRTMLLSTNLGTQMLYFSAHRIVASNYHREGAAIEYAWEAMAVTTEADLRRYLAVRKVDTVLLCPDTLSSKHSILMAIYSGKTAVPAWMRRMELQGVPDWRGMPKKIHAPLLLERVDVPKSPRAGTR